MSALWLLLGDLLVLFGLLAMTVALLGFWRMPDLFTRMHATAKIAPLGLTGVLLGTSTRGDPWFALQALVIAAFLLFTMPIATYALAKAARSRDREGLGERLQPPAPPTR
jgi:monovalent cation/proton antiporter MnhG/PhaG subunit